MLRSDDMKLLIMTDYNYPTDNPYLEEIIVKNLPLRGYKLNLIMKSKKRIISWTEDYWNHTLIYLIPGGLIGQLFYFKKIRRIASECDIIQVRNDIPLGLIAIFLSRSLKKPFVFRYSHLKADTLVLEAGENVFRYFNLKFYKGTLGKFLTRIILRNAQWIFTISDAMKEHLVEDGIDSEKMIPVTSGTDLSIISKKIDSSNIIEKFQLKNHMVLCYVGTMNRIRNLDFLIEIIEKLKNEFPVKLLMVGEGKRKEDLNHLKNLTKQKDLEEYIIFTGKVPRSEVPKYISAADICVSSLPPNKVFRTSSPLKLMEYMSMGKPIVCNNENVEQRNIISKNQAGMCVKYDVGEFVKAIEYLNENPGIAKEMGIRGKKYIQENRSYEILADKVEKEYFNILSLVECENR